MSQASDRRELVAKVLDLRTKARTWEQIGEELSLVPSTARRYYAEAISEHRETPERVRDLVALDLLRLDRAMARAIRDLESEDWERAHSAIDRVVKVVTARARLLGIDTPRVQQILVQQLTLGDTSEDERRARLLAMLGK